MLALKIGINHGVRLLKSSTVNSLYENWKTHEIILDEISLQNGDLMGPSYTLTYFFMIAPVSCSLSKNDLSSRFAALGFGIEKKKDLYRTTLL